MTTKELQKEELEVLQSIYESDTAFKQVDENTFQYKVGEDGSNKSFVIEVKWSEKYPDELPNINLNAFYNNHISESNKIEVINKLKEEIEPFVGSAVTYTLFEYARENAEDLIPQTESTAQLQDDKVQQTNRPEDNHKKKEKKEQLTKAQKRKLYNRFGNQQNEKPRGWDWVDVIRHLSQTGSQPKFENS